MHTAARHRDFRARSPTAFDCVAVKSRVWWRATAEACPRPRTGRYPKMAESSLLNPRSKMRSAQACLTTSAHSTPALTKLPLAQLESLRKSKLSRSSYAQSSTVKSSSSELLSKSRLISVMDYLTHSTMTLSSTNSTTLLKDEYLVLRALYSMHSLI